MSGLNLLSKISGTYEKKQPSGFEEEGEEPNAVAFLNIDKNEKEALVFKYGIEVPLIPQISDSRGYTLNTVIYQTDKSVFFEVTSSLDGYDMTFDLYELEYIEETGQITLYYFYAKSSIVYSIYNVRNAHDTLNLFWKGEFKRGIQKSFNLKEYKKVSFGVR